ncbi:MAG: sel1 repeat family protein [Candidatus Riflebacteria bacterium]|nr:sel1 repeat family protein [Candidatus Riflebacteria bacterium]
MKKTTAFIILFSVLLVFATGCCKKELNLKEASKAYLRGDYKEAAEIFLPKAEKGDAEAMVNIAFMYYCGMHVKQDFVQAARWYTKAAERNHPNAQFSLATLYENGEGVEQDLEEAYFWYSLAEKHGDEDAKRSRIELEQKISKTHIKFLKERIENWQPL